MRTMVTVGILCGMIGVAGYFLIADWKKALGFIIIASLLDIFWDTVITAYEKHQGLID